jgi:hypothetical protein
VTDTPNRIARVLSGVLIFQLMLGGLLILGDSSDGTGLRAPDFGPSAPALRNPVDPGDQRRRFRPRDVTPTDTPGRNAKPMPKRLTLTVLEGAVYRLEGTIDDGDAGRVLALIDRATPRPERLVLNSPGGSVGDALDLGRAIRRMGIATDLRAGDACMSACPYVLAGGAQRSIDDTALVGVHQHYFGQNTLLPAAFAVEDIQHGQGEVMRYLIDMGIDPAVMQHALTTPPDQIYVLLPDQLEAYGFIGDGDRDGD